MQPIAHILIGPQGAGKTTWALRDLAKISPDVSRISQDEMGKGAHYKEFLRCLTTKVSVVVDRMNFSRWQRNKYTAAARASGYKIVFVLFDTPRDVCANRMSERFDHPTIAHDANHQRILDVYFNGFEPPVDGEYDELIIIDY